MIFTKFTPEKAFFNDVFPDFIEGFIFVSA